MRTRSLVVGYFHPIFLTNSDTPQAHPPAGCAPNCAVTPTLASFGLYATPERRLMFDINDFDETLPGPFEWDVKRLAASMSVAGQANGHHRRERRATVR